MPCCIACPCYTVPCRALQGLAMSCQHAAVLPCHNLPGIASTMHCNALQCRACRCCDAVPLLYMASYIPSCRAGMLACFHAGILLSSCRQNTRQACLALSFHGITQGLFPMITRETSLARPPLLWFICAHGKLYTCNLCKPCSILRSTCYHHHRSFCYAACYILFP